MKHIPKNDIGRIVIAVDRMKVDPFNGDIVKLAGEYNIWRRRVGNYRIKYRLCIDEKIIDIYDIDHRKSNTY